MAETQTASGDLGPAQLAQPREGRHRQSREYLFGDQRQRFLEAMAAALEDRGGYMRTSVADILDQADLGRTTFYNHFEDKRACFDATYAHAERELLDRVEAACGAQEQFGDRVRAAVAASLGFLARAPGMARVLAVEPLVVGEGAPERQEQTVERLAAMLRTGREEGTQADDLAEITEVGLIGGAFALVSKRAQMGERKRLGELGSDLIETLLTPYLGRDEARRLARERSSGAPPGSEAPPAGGTGEPASAGGQLPDADRARAKTGLPRGRWALPAEVVADDQRQRLLVAVVVAAAEHGYAQMTISHVASKAGVSRGAFYQQFPGGKEECFSVAFEENAKRLLETMMSVGESQGGFRERVEASVAAALERFGAWPPLARVLTVEALAAGPTVARLHQRRLSHFAALLHKAAEADPDLPTLPPVTELAIVAGAASLISRHLLDSRPDSLPDLAPDLVALVTGPYLGFAEQSVASTPTGA